MIRMADEKEEIEIRDPSKEGWLSDICPVPVEKLVTVLGVRKLPGRLAEYCDGEGTYHTRDGYKDYTEGLTGFRLDPCAMWQEMGHDIECEAE